MSKEKISGIYCIENLVNSKKYIGLSMDINKRWKEHITYLNGDYHINDHLQASWNKYGINNFKFYIVEECEEHLIKEREIYYIKLYKTKNRNFGYNKTSGGDGTKDKSPEILEKMSLKITKRAILQFDLDGNFIKKHRNCSKAAEELCSSSIENIRNCCDKKYGYKTQMGFIWMYEDDYLKNGINVDDYLHDKYTKPVAQYDLNGNYIATYESAREAQKQTGIGYKMISRVCNGIRPYTHGYIFEFVN